MAAFRFRLQTALDLRFRQEDEAKAALALAETRRAEASARRDDAHAALSATLERSLEAEGRTGELTERLWYRNWIVAQRHEVERRQHELDAREATVRQATAVAQEAHRKRRVLERLKARAAASFGAEERRQEQKGFDDLGTLRFTTARRGDDQ